MIKCVVIDDEPMAVDILKEYIRKVPFLELCGDFNDPAIAIDQIRKIQPDVLFLDINMPDINGFDLLSIIETNCMVVFTTAYSEYAVRSFDFEVIDYLLKPIEFERFMKAAHKVKKSHETARGISKDSSVSSITIKSGTQNIRLNTDDVLYIEGAGNYLNFISKSKKIMTLMKMDEALNLLPENFIRIHKSFIINVNQIEQFSIDLVIIQGHELPISKSYKHTVENFK